MKPTLTISNASGYWGDDPSALQRQMQGGHQDYIVMDFLSEVTMSILKKQKSKNPQSGYTHHLISMLKPVLKTMIETNTRLITNAGGMNPLACAKAIHDLGKSLGLNPKIAVVHGDDIFDQIQTLEAQGVPFTHMDTQQELKEVKSKLQVANVYFGGYPVAQALKNFEPHILITGRLTDTGLSLGAMIHEFGWSFQDWDLLASGIVAGHLLECGSQVSGGNYTDWTKVPSFHHIGFPVVHMKQDGSFILTKHPQTGGLINSDTVKEQLFYEIGRSPWYMTPDVVADFSSIQVEDLGKDQVQISQVKGAQPTQSYKISMAYDSGFKVSGSLAVSGPKAKEKAQAFSDILWKRYQHNVCSETATDYIGWNAIQGKLSHDKEASEILLRFSAKHEEEAPLQEFARLIPSLILGGPPGICVIGGVAKPQSLINFWPSLIPKDKVSPHIGIFDPETQKLTQNMVLKEAPQGNFQEPLGIAYQKAEKATADLETILEKEKHLPHTLADICFARSGDKGDMANIGLCARSKEAYEFMKEHITAQRVKNWFQELCLGEVSRFPLDNLLGLNFILEKSLGGGGSSTLRLDAQGKSYAQALLRQHIAIPEHVLKSV